MDDIDFKNRMDQLCVLDMIVNDIPFPKGKVTSITFSRVWYDNFVTLWENSKCEMPFDVKVQVVAGGVILLMHPELSSDDVYELSKICAYILSEHYNITAQDYEKFCKEMKSV